MFAICLGEVVLITNYKSHRDVFTNQTGKKRSDFGVVSCQFSSQNGVINAEIWDSGLGLATTEKYSLKHAILSNIDQSATES